MKNFVHSNTDIGSCVSRSNDTVELINCLGDDGLNFCCRQPGSAKDLIEDKGVRVCCSYESYTEQAWIVLVTIQSYGASKVDVRAVKYQRVIRDLLKKQILHKPRSMADISVVQHIKNLSKRIRNIHKRRREVNEQVKKEKNTLTGKDLKSTQKSLTKSLKSSLKSPTRSPIKKESRSPTKLTTSGSKSPKSSVKLGLRSPTKSPISSFKSPRSPVSAYNSAKTVRSPNSGRKSPKRSS